MNNNHDQIIFNFLNDCNAKFGRRKIFGYCGLGVSNNLLYYLEKSDLIEMHNDGFLLTEKCINLLAVVNRLGVKNETA